MPRPPFSRASAWPAIGAPGPRPSTNVSSAYSSGTFPLMRSKGGTDVRQLNPSQSSNSDVTTTIAGTAVTSKDRKSAVEGQRVSVRVHIGGRRSVKKKQKIQD